MVTNLYTSIINSVKKWFCVKICVREVIEKKEIVKRLIANLVLKNIVDSVFVLRKLGQLFTFKCYSEGWGVEAELWTGIDISSRQNTSVVLSSRLQCKQMLLVRGYRGPMYVMLVKYTGYGLANRKYTWVPPKLQFLVISKQNNAKSMLRLALSDHQLMVTNNHKLF